MCLFRKFFSSCVKEKEETKEEEIKLTDSEKKKKIRKINPRDKEFMDLISNSSKNNTPERPEKI